MSLPEIQILVDELAASAARNYDPVRFSVIKSLSRKCRSVTYTDNPSLEKILRSRLEEYQSSLKDHRQQTRGLADDISSKFPQHADCAQSLIDQCQFKQLERLYRRLNQTLKNQTNLNALRALTDEINQSAEQHLEENQIPSLNQLLRVQEQEVRFADNNTEKIEIKQEPKQRDLKSMQGHRVSKKRFNVDKVIAKAINSSPENPGPHNPHMLAINALTQLRDLSPQYSRRFAGYFDTLLWLEKNSSKLV